MPDYTEDLNPLDWPDGTSEWWWMRIIGVVYHVTQWGRDVEDASGLIWIREECERHKARFLPAPYPPSAVDFKRKGE